MGFANFYRRSIKDFAKKASLLHKLLRKETEWKWTPDHQNVFESLKQTFCEEPTLVYPDSTKRLRVEADASGFATGAVLSMLCDDGKWRPCAYSSKSLSDVE